MNKHMDDLDLERDLRQAFRKTEAPAGLTARVLQRTVARTTSEEHIAWWRRPALAWSLASVLVLGAVGGTESWRAHEQRVEGERAKAQLMLALRITGQKVQFAQSKLRQESAR
jgi:hypothetical protein